MHTKVRHIYDNWVLHGARVGGGGERLIPAAVFLPMNCRTGNGEILPWRVVRTNSQLASHNLGNIISCSKYIFYLFGGLLQ